MLSELLELLLPLERSIQGCQRLEASAATAELLYTMVNNRTYPLAGLINFNKHFGLETSVRKSSFNMNFRMKAMTINITDKLERIASFISF